MCPVLSFEKYVSKLNPNLDRLWQRPRISTAVVGSGRDDEQWYTRSPIGVNTIGSFLSDLSKKLNLKTVYTNHCIRVTAITVLNYAKFESRHIMGLSRHKSEESIRTYSRRTPDSVKSDMSSTLANAVIGQGPRHDIDTEVETPATFDLGFEISSSQEETMVNFFSNTNQQKSEQNISFKPVFQNCNVTFNFK